MLFAASSSSRQNNPSSVERHHEREQYDREERTLEREFEHGEGEAGE